MLKRFWQSTAVYRQAISHPYAGQRLLSAPGAHRGRHRQRLHCRFWLHASRQEARNYANPPALTFATTIVGSTSSDSPQTVTVMNDGNASLSYSVPASGDNPVISAGFTLSGASTCPQLTSTSAVATLAAGSSCTDKISFTPVAGGPDHGTLVTTDDNLNTTGATQTIPLNGNALIVPTIVFTIPDHVYGDPPFTVAATSNSPGAFTYSVIVGSAVISGTTVTLTGAGVVFVQVDQAASGIYTGTDWTLYSTSRRHRRRSTSPRRPLP